MKVVVGSTNPAKVLSVTDFFKNLEVKVEVSGVAASSQVSEQPSSLEETLAGAKSRAKNALKDNDLAIGLEGGIFYVEETNQYLQVCACSVYDGKTFGTGLSSAFELPQDVISQIHNYEVDLNQALFQLGYTDSPEVGKQGGAVGLFTRGGLKRPEYMAQALQMAIIPFLDTLQAQR